MNFFNNMTLKWKLTTGFALPLLLLVIMATTVSTNLTKLLKIDELLNHTHEILETGDEIIASLVDMETGLRGYLLTGDQDFLEPYHAGKEHFGKLMDHGYELVSDTPSESAVLKKLERLKQDWQNTHVSVSMAIRQDVNDGKAPATDIPDFMAKGIGKKYMDKMRGLMNDFVEKERLLVKIRTNEQHENAANTTNILTIGTIIALLLGIVGAILLIRNLGRQIGGEPTYATEVANRIADGDLEAEVDINPTDSSSLLYAMKIMRENLLNRATLDHTIATETSRIKSALDVCNTNIMVADDNLDIIYMNASVLSMMKTAEADLKKDLPKFDANTLIGTNIDTFYKNPAHQRGILKDLRSTHNEQINLGGRIFGLTSTPIFSNTNERIGTVVEWEDRTDRLAKEKAATILADENASIKLALDVCATNVMMTDTGLNINYTNAAVQNMMRIAESDMKSDIPSFNANNLMGMSLDIFHKDPVQQRNILKDLRNTYKTDIKIGSRTFDLIATPTFDTQNERLGTVIEWSDRTAQVNIEDEMNSLISAANNGDLSQRLETDSKTGFFKGLSEGLNILMTSTEVFISDVGDIFEGMSNGDLTKTIVSEYRGEFNRIKINANNSVTKLSEVLTKIQSSSRTVETSATEVAQGSDDLSRRTESQASSLEETASSMEEITATVKQTSESAMKSNTLANDAKNKAVQGGKVVQGAVVAMSEILDSSNKINDIISVIDEIAFQTNLLALNAAVEAARAGEQGRGFAVVAGEVRTLSQRSAAAAKEIKDLIRDSVNKVESGSALVNQSGQMLTEIVQAVDNVASMINDVNTAANEQNSGISQINQAITQMDEMTQQNAALVEESSAASRAMSEESKNMNNMISFFNMRQGGGASASSFSSKQEPVIKYKSSPASVPTPSAKHKSSKSGKGSKGNDGAASFSNTDEWEDF
jgi:methyl-accepting chemotaxis protein